MRSLCSLLTLSSKLRQAVHRPLPRPRRPGTQDRILQLITLDRELTGEMLLRHPEKFSVPSVVEQLKGRRDLQHWYLGLLFDRAPDMYGSQEYAPFHTLQVCHRASE